MTYVIETDDQGLGVLFKVGDGVESRAQRIHRLEQLGLMDPDCPSSYCKDRYAAPDPVDVFAPTHRASPGCRSGGRPHCTCDTCW